MTTTMVEDAATGTMGGVVVHSSTSEAEAYQRAIALKNLPHGWDYRDGKTPTTEAINAALTYIGLVADLRLPALGDPFISPMSEGGVQLEWDNGARRIEIEITPDGIAKYVIIDNTGPKFGDFDAPPKLWQQLFELFGWLTAMP